MAGASKFRLTDEQVEDIRRIGSSGYEKRLAEVRCLYPNLATPKSKKPVQHRPLDCFKHPGTPRDKRNQCIECRREYNRLCMRRSKNYDDWWEKQKGRCAFCGESMVYDSNTNHLDHDHETGRKRGLVHAKCNHQIAGIENTLKSVGLKRALQYLQVYPTA